MIIRCKKGCLCSDINKDYCCIECDNFDNCAEPCEYLLDGNYHKEDILELCKNAN